MSIKKYVGSTALAEIISKFRSYICNDIESCIIQTDNKHFAGSGAVTELNTNLTANGQPFRYAYDSESDKYGFMREVDGADTFFPFRDSEVIYLGTGKTFDVTQYYDDYQNLTVDDFLYTLVSGGSAGSGWKHVNAAWNEPSYYYAEGGGSGNLGYTKTYNPSTGLLTINVTANWSASVSGHTTESVSGSYTADVRAFLVKRSVNIDYLTFSSPNSFTVGVASQGLHNNGTLEYSYDKKTWTTWDGTTINSSGNKIYLRGTNNTHFATSTSDVDRTRFELTGSDISCSGNIETLLDWYTTSLGEHPVMDAYCFRKLFDFCSELISAPKLPATTLSNYCYHAMFKGCTSLINAPTLPATTLTNSCYASMFEDCSSLVNAPALPATTLANSCYMSMFYRCTSLINAPTLPATTLADSCYTYMFGECTSLIIPPALPAMTMTHACYNNMFTECTSLNKVPALPATNLYTWCYSYMFKGCTSLKFSETQTSEYMNAYVFGTTPTSYADNIFQNTGGTFTGNPTKTTYFTANEVIV